MSEAGNDNEGYEKIGSTEKDSRISQHDDE